MNLRINLLQIKTDGLVIASHGRFFSVLFVDIICFKERWLQFRMIQKENLLIHKSEQSRIR